MPRVIRAETSRGVRLAVNTADDRMQPYHTACCQSQATTLDSTYAVTDIDDQ
jgi:hypothetical protein